MSRTVAQELLMLVALTATGMGVGLFFDCYRLLRRYTKPGYFLTQVTDLLFWIISAGVAYYVFMILTGGGVRLFSILLIPAGMGIYLKLLSPFVLEPLLWCFQQTGLFLRFLWRAFVFCWRTLLFPFCFAVCLLGFSLQFLCGVFRLLLLPLQWGWRTLRRSLLEWCRRRRKKP